jgi:hypothetical protein
VIDAGAPNRLISGGHRARHEQVPSRLCPIAVHFDVIDVLELEAVGSETRELRQKPANTDYLDC